MDEKEMDELGYEALMRFRIKDTRLDMAGAFFSWIDEWCLYNGYGKALVGGDPEGYTMVCVKRKQGDVKVER